MGAAMSASTGAVEDLFLPEPTRREVKYTVISVDDHLVEPAHMFEGRLPANMAHLAPVVKEDEKGYQYWDFDGQRINEVGMNAQAGRRRGTFGLEPFRFEHMRRGCWDIEARISDMDINGVWASLNFPSSISGFCGRVFSSCSDPKLGLAVTEAWNDWLYEEWYSPYPDRIIPLGITFLTDPQLGAAEVRRNAARGFRSVSLPERPQGIGLPSLFGGYWDPIIEAVVETDTVISLHVGSSGGYPRPQHIAAGTGLALGSTMFGQLSLAACAEWLWSGYAVRFPTIKIAMSEGGIGWVPMLLDRLDNVVDRSGYGHGDDNFGLEMSTRWDERPADVLKRNFYFCTIDDPSTIDCRDRIGVDHIMVEVDYPHGDGTWPNTQAVIERYWGHIPAAELRAMCSENAARLYRHPLPETILP
jgi:predicted TIM-barrel fold metal-dependent hydrolase